MANLIKGNFKAIIGIDWANKKHYICLQSADSNKRVFSNLLHNVESIDEWALALFEKFNGPIAIAVELTKGPIVYALQKYDFITLFPDSFIFPNSSTISEKSD